jgi:type II secretory ATPase GspE/PulE/Tfp pilus assembly ATPase PilB-like protein
MPAVYLIQCFNCLSDFDAADAIWCSCNPQRPTKVCPFCMGCFCAAGPEFKDAFWRHAPASLHEEIDTLSQSRMLIGEMLVRSGLITTGQLLEALNRQKTDGRRLGEILVDSGALPPDRIERFLRSQHTAVVVDLARARVDAMMLRRLGVDQCLRDRILPLEAEVFHDRHIMTLAMADPSNGEALQRVVSATGYQVIPGVLPADTIVSVIRSIFPQGSATSPGSPDPEGRTAAPVGLAQAILRQAVRRRASHIQIQAMQGMLKLFLRVDGTLYLDRARSPHDVAAALEAFKALAGLEGDTRTVPRAARAEATADGKPQVVVVRTRPGREGEEMSVKRIDPESFPPSIDSLGFPDAVSSAFSQALGSEAGLLLVTSPPWSGASSTLHALARGAQAMRPTALVESPRSVDCPGALHLEFFPEIRGSLHAAMDRAESSGARAVVVTASEGVVWNTGHADLSARMLVIARAEAITLPEALLRLARAGYPAAALASRPTWIVHQRLLRRVCPACRMPAGNGEEHAAALGLTSDDAARMMLWRGAGCDLCAATPGFNGRVPLAQLLVPGPEVARAVEEGSPAGVRDACRAAGLVPMRREAMAALAAGLTTVEEVTRRRMG